MDEFEEHCFTGVVEFRLAKTGFRGKFGGGAFGEKSAEFTEAGGVVGCELDEEGKGRA